MQYVAKPLLGKQESKIIKSGINEQTKILNHSNKINSGKPLAGII